ncbi:cutinase family protein [Leucobacter sp. UT-8R-CII-1-4]|uniref:cutinase family protein n=1 Tax=Leucobacter sp. UT-8R-CII-1-4 TaxID=3040075 RepID=UPI0024A7C2A2|nr:cutinase family protein [Leucobacter sp. UT-8R-CII-1-4]MDI6024388.1 cutinase family protein [Leucobacter sp. UT-8R-CII-1-4]
MNTGIRAGRMRRFWAPIGVATVAAPLLLSLAACSQVPDAEENIDSLTSVTEAPAPPVAADEYDIKTNPEPIVEAMDCTPYLVVTARGTGEPNKGQLLSPVARAVKKALPTEVTVLDLDYPADTDVNEGGTYATRLLLDTLNVQAEACPKQEFALLGYSQGALIIGDALSPVDARLVGATVGELSEEAQKRILAVVLYGNPRFNGEERYDVGSFDEKLGGILPRTTGSLEPYAERIQDFCVKGDFICQSNMELDEKGHVAYFKNGMQQDGSNYVLAQIAMSKALKAITPGDAATDSTPGETATPPSTPAQ